jgi:WD40 repeat protein
MSFLAAPPTAPAIDPTKVREVSSWPHTSPLVCARFDPSGAFVFAGAQDNTIVRWTVPEGKKVVLTGHKSWVRSLAFSARDGLLFSGDYAGRLLAWPVAGDAPAPRWDITAHRGWIRALASSPDSRRLASCGNDHLVRLWHVPDGQPLRTLDGHDCHVYNVAFHPDGKWLASADLKGNVKVWDVERGECVRELDARILHKYDGVFRADIGGARGMAFDPEGKYLACCGITNVSNAFAGVGNPLVVLFDWASGKQKAQLKPRAPHQGTAWGVAIHPLGFILAAGGGNGGELWVWKPDDPLSWHTLKLAGNARDLSLHPKGRLVAIPCHDSRLRLYDLASAAR